MSKDSYDITENDDGSVTVNHARGTAIDGIDTLWNIERLRFTDGTVELGALVNTAATGTVTISDTTPTENQVLTVTRSILDADGFGPNPLFITTWQAQLDGDWTAVQDGLTFTPSDSVVGSPLRVVVTFVDRLGAPEQVIGAATQPVANVNDLPVGAPVISSNPPTVGVSLTVGLGSIADADGEPSPLDVQWLRGNTNTVITGATSTTYVPTAADLGQTLRVRVSYTDLQGTAETLLSTPTAAVVAAPVIPPVIPPVTPPVIPPVTPPVVTPLVPVVPPVTPPVTPPAAPEEFVGLSAPFRSLDTRVSTGVLPSGSVTVVDVSTAGVPADAVAVSLNVTATGTAGAGFVTVYPCDAAQPNTSNLNFVGGQTIANAVLGKPSAAGTICLFNSIGTELIVDIGGYLPAGFAYDAITPVRLLDTRSGAVVPANTVTQVPVTGANGVAGDAKAAALNVTAANAGAGGYLTVFPCGQSQPTASSLNFATGQTIPGAVLATIGQGGAVCIFNSAPTHLLVDLAGSFAAGAAYTRADSDTGARHPSTGVGGGGGRYERRGVARRGHPWCGCGGIDRDSRSATGRWISHRLCLRNGAERVEPQLRGRASDRQHGDRHAQLYWIHLCLLLGDDALDHRRQRRLLSAR